MRRVVVTGLGMVSPLGCGVEPSWSRLLAGQSGARRIEEFDVSDLACKIAMPVPRGGGDNGTFNPDQWMEPKEQRKIDDFILYAVAAAAQALADAGWKPSTYEEQIKTGVLIGSGIGGLGGIAETAIVLKEKGPRRVSPFFIPGRLINLAGGYVSIQHGLKGPNHAVVTACSTGTHAIGDAGAPGRAWKMPKSWSRGAPNRRSIASASPDSPPAGPYPRISTTGQSKPRGPTIRTATVSSWARAPAVSSSKPTNTPRRAAPKFTPSLSATACRATPTTSPRPRRAAMAPSGPWRRRSSAPGFRRATSTISTRMEPRRRSATKSRLQAVERLAGDGGESLSMSSTKSAIGHLLGAAGAVEAIFSILAIRDQIVPPTLNLDQSLGGNGNRSRAAQGAQARCRIRPVEFLRLWRHQRLLGFQASAMTRRAKARHCGHIRKFRL